MDLDFQLFTSLRYDTMLLGMTVNTEAWDGSIKHSSPFYMLPYHRDRMLEAAEYFGWKEAAARIRGSDGFTYLLQKLNEAIDITSSTPLRIRTLLSHNGNVTVESSPVPAVAEESLFPARMPPPQSTVEVNVSPLTGGALTVGSNDSVHGDPPKEEAWVVVQDPRKTTPSPYTTFKTTNRDMYNSARERAGIMDFAEKREVLIVSDLDGAIMEGSLTSIFLWRNGKWTTPPVSSGGQAGTTRRWALEKKFCVEDVVKAESLVDGEDCWISNGVRGFIFGKVKLS